MTLSNILHISCQGASFLRPADEYCAFQDAAGLCKKSIGLSGSTAGSELDFLSVGLEAKGRAMGAANERRPLLKLEEQRFISGNVTSEKVS